MILNNAVFTLKLKSVKKLLIAVDRKRAQKAGSIATQDGNAYPLSEVVDSLLVTQSVNQPFGKVLKQNVSIWTPRPEGFNSKRFENNNIVTDKATIFSPLEVLRSLRTRWITEDTVDHTVQVCPAWEGHRRVLVEAIGSGDLSRPALVQAMVRGEREWDAVASFSEAVMLEKETAELQRVRTSHPGRRAGPGRHHGRRVSRDDSRPP